MIWWCALGLCAGSDAVAAAAKPVVSVSAPAKAFAGDRLNVAVSVRNAARATKLTVRLSTDARLSPSDAVLARANLPAIKPRKRSRRSLRVRLPATLRAARHYLIVCVARTRRPRIRQRCSKRRITVSRRPGIVNVGPPLGPLPAPAGGPGIGGSSDPGPGGGGPTNDPGPQPPAPGPQDAAAAEPSTLATALPRAQPTSLREATSFLYTGSDAIQTGVAAGTIDERRVAILRGTVRDRAGASIGGVRVRIADHPELGRTATQADGGYDIAVNGGGPLTLVFERAGYISAQRLVDAPWEDYAEVDPVVLIPYSAKSTLIDTDTAVAVAVGDAVTDDRGTRSPALVFAAGTQATMTLPNGSTESISQLRVRITEYTQGASGPEAMPAQLPPSSAYTYAVELSVDEAVDAGATRVTFDRPVAFYTDNFLDLPVGRAMPIGSYDREAERWEGSPDGRVVKIVGESAGAATVDGDGDGVADTRAALTALGLDDAELQSLATLYDPGVELWRVELTHFSPLDCNPLLGTDGAVDPDNEQPPGDFGDPCPPDSGSMISCITQVLAEELRITGSRHSLYYRSDRVAGRTASRTLDIPVTGDDLPPPSADLRRILLEVHVAGRVFTEEFPEGEIEPNMVHQFTWDGEDAYDRPVQGAQTATVRIGYVYGFFYQSAGESPETWALLGTVFLGSSPFENASWQEYEVEIGTYDTSGVGLGGWVLDVLHAYDPTSRRLYLGSGDQRLVDATDVTVLETIAGVPSEAGFAGDGGPALEARLDAPHGLALAPDGTTYVADTNNERIRRVEPDGTIETHAGNGAFGFAGDGGAATAAKLASPRGVAVGPDGEVYIADTGNNRIRRVDAGGDIDTVAGGGDPADDLGDDGPATDARLSAPAAVAVAPDGRLVIADTFHHRLRMVSTSGQITTIAGDGNAGSGGDGGPAAQARLRFPRAVSFDPNGNVLVADSGNGRVRRIAADGRITTIAGGGDPADGVGDGGPATSARLVSPNAVVQSPDGRILVTDAGHERIRSIETDGSIRSVAGGGDASGNGSAATDTGVPTPTGLAAAPNGDFYVASELSPHVMRGHLLLEGFSDGDILIASEDGTRIYQFTPEGRHVRTREALTGGVIHEFAYDSAGRLGGVSDPQGPLLTIERDGDGDPTGIVARGGAETTLALDGNGLLSSVENPAGDAIGLTYAAGGLLTGLEEPSGDLHGFEYDELGRLKRDEGPGGMVKTLARTQTEFGNQVTVTTGGGRTWTYLDELFDSGSRRMTVTDPAGAITRSTFLTDGGRIEALPTGEVVEIETGPDPRFGMQAPVGRREVSTTPDGLTRTVFRTREVTVDDETLTELEDTIDVNGRVTTRRYEDAAGPGGELSMSSPAGRGWTSKLDNQGRVTETTAADGKLPVAVAYGSNGEIGSVTQGTRVATYGYDARHRLQTRTDALGNVFAYAYDEADRRTGFTVDGRTWTTAYDDDGERSSSETPLGHDYGFTSTPDGFADTMSLPGSGVYDTAYSTDRLRTGRTEPSGAAQTWTVDAPGRLAGVSSPETAAAFAYVDETQLLGSTTWNTGGGAAEQTLAMTYDGLLPKTALLSGAAAGEFTYTSDDDHQLSGWSLEAAGESRDHPIVRDDDRLVVEEGPWTISRDADSGETREITDGTSTVSSAHNGFGEFDERTVSSGATEAYRLEIDRDDAGRISERRETVGGTLHTFDYAYDDSGALLTVERDAVVVESWSYDANGNRTTGGAAYDSQDRLTSGGRTFDADGFLNLRGADDFDYGRRGELLRAQVAGHDIAFDYDGLGRLVRRADDADVTQFLYGSPDDPLRVTASIDEAGDLTTYYYDDAGALHGLDREGDRYAVGSDQIGTPRVVTDAAGAIVKSVERDSWGAVLSQTGGAFELPIGFAGGIEDPVTGLVRFGYRDYELAVGRWTARDPSFFAGSPFNLYMYAANDPVSLRDPTGLVCVGASGYAGIGGGLEICYDPFGDKGVGMCAEAGTGAGAGFGLDLFGQPENNTRLFYEINGDVGPFGAGIGWEVDSCGRWRYVGSGGAGVVGGKFEGWEPGVEVEAGADFGVKFGVKWCTTGGGW